MHDCPLKKLNSLQKQTVRIIFNKSKFDHTRELFLLGNILNLYKLNIFNTALFMQRIHTKQAPPILQEKFKLVTHHYPTRSSNLNYEKPKLVLTKAKYKISFRGPTVWNEFLDESLKSIEYTPLFKIKTKSKLLNFNQEMQYF